jgi:hypothetical protein
MRLAAILVFYRQVVGVFIGVFDLALRPERFAEAVSSPWFQYSGSEDFATRRDFPTILRTRQGDIYDRSLRLLVFSLFTGFLWSSVASSPYTSFFSTSQFR